METIMYMQDDLRQNGTHLKEIRKYHVYEDFSDSINRLNLDVCRTGITYIFMKDPLKAKYYPSQELENMKSRKAQRMIVISCIKQYLKANLNNPDKESKVWKNITRWELFHNCLIQLNWIL